MAGDRARTLMSRIETRASGLIIFFIFVDCHKQGIIPYMKTKTYIKLNKSVACKVFHKLALLIKMEHALSTQPFRDVLDIT